MNNISQNPTMIILKDLLEIPAPSGREEHIAALIRQKIEELGITHRTDGAGNLIDGSPLPPGAHLKLDEKPAIWSKNALTHYDQRLIKVFTKAAETAGTSLQYVVHDHAASDASPVYSTGGAMRAACIGHVRENSHGFEVIHSGILDNLFWSIIEFIKLWEGE